MMKRRAEARRSGSVPARFPGRNLMFFARGKTRKTLAEMDCIHFCETKKAPHMGGAVLTPCGSGA